MTLPYRQAVGAMIVNAEGKALVAKRIDMVSESWQMPQGGMDAGEEPFTTVKRELREEIGTDEVELIAQSKEWMSYDLPADLIPRVMKGRYRGQRQKWFLLRFTGQNSDIDLHTHEPEFSEWKWVDPATLPDLIVPFKRQLYIDIVSEFMPLIGINPAC